jgi:tetratricopeptide (TPR) repeat protein
VKAAAEAERAAAEKAEAERAAAEKAEAERAAAEKAEAERAAAEKAEAEKEKAEAPAASAEDASKLKKEALSFLNRGRYKDAIEVSRAAIAADPTDALPYLYLGSALQDTGKWKDGLAAYSDCVRNATKGPVHECRAMGGRK